MPFNMSQFHYFEHNQTHRGVIIASLFIASDVRHSFALSSPGQRITCLPSDKAYEGDRIPINVNKIIDIKKVFQYIDESHRDFFNTILLWPVRQ